MENQEDGDFWRKKLCSENFKENKTIAVYYMRKIKKWSFAGKFHVLEGFHFNLRNDV